MADTDKLVKVGQLDAVADAVIEVVSDTNERLDNYIAPYIDWESGGLSTNGVLYSDESVRSDRIRANVAFQHVEELVLTKTAPNTDVVNVYAFFYDKNGNYLNYTTTNIIRAGITITPPENCVYIRVSLSLSSVSDVETKGVKIFCKQNLALSQKDGTLQRFELNTVQNDLSGLMIESNISWEQGGIGTNGILYKDETVRSDRVRANVAFKNITELKVYKTSNASVNVIAFAYDAQGEFISNTTYVIAQTGTVIPVSEGTVYIRLALMLTSVEDVTTNGIHVTVRQNPALNQKDDVINSINTSSIINAPSVTPYVMGSVNQIARLGWMPTQTGYPPEQSIASYRLAYKNGIRIMLCDVRVTSDGEFVCWHNNDLSNIARHTDGTELTSTEKAQLISNLTLAELDAYDYGIYRGSEYAGTKILRLEEFLKWCSMLNCWAFLEMKIDASESQISVIADLVKSYKLGDRTLVAEPYTTANTEHWIAALPNCSFVVIGAVSNPTSAYNKALQAVAGGLTAYISWTSPEELTDEYYKNCIAHNIAFWYTEITSVSTFDTFYESGYFDKYKLVSSSWVNICQRLYNKVMY